MGDQVIRQRVPQKPADGSSSQTVDVVQPGQSLDEKQIRSELSLLPVDIDTQEKVDPELDRQADAYVATLLGKEHTKEDKAKAIDQLGFKIQQASTRKSGLLQEPIRNLAKSGAEGGEVATALTDLQVQVEALDPAQLDFKPGWFARTLGFIPGVGPSLKRYFLQYESAQTVINAILLSLEKSRGQLERDNVILSGDQADMRKLTFQLAKFITLAQLMDEKLQSKLLEPEIVQDDEKCAFIQEELLFPLRQRIMDLQQQLAVNQQGVLAMEIIIRNNRELIRGVYRAETVTISALRIAVTVAVALTHQKIVLDKINALNTTTSNLISQTAMRLKTQGVDIQKQASNTMLNMKDLRSAFSDIHIAMTAIANFRTEALDKMKNNIDEMEIMTKDAEKDIDKMEKGNQARASTGLSIDVDASFEPGPR